MKDENEIKRRVRWALGDAFEIREEVSGSHSVYGSPVRIDFMVRYKGEPSFARGFTEEWFGIEAKHVQPHDTIKGAKLGAQCASYSQCNFMIDDEPILPACVLYAIPPYSTDAMGEGIREMLYYMRVGHLMFDTRPDKWEIRFGQERYAYAHMDFITVKEKIAPMRIRVGSI